ncbi:MAG: hypothetical protein ACLQU4_12755 [Limisphaerales bacterium]
MITDDGNDVNGAVLIVNEIWTDEKEAGKSIEKRDEVGDNGGSGSPLAGA